jgi:CheY-like chemotaxis protein
MFARHINLLYNTIRDFTKGRDFSYREGLNMASGIKILMVDDDKMLIDMYKERLELAGFQVEISRDGEEGLAKVHQVKPDIVLLDIMMPKVNGYEALAAIKSDPATKNIPVIILSALMRDINKSKAVEAGADDYIIKSEAMPVDVIKKVEAVLKKYHKELPPTPEKSVMESAPVKAEPKPEVNKPVVPAEPLKPITAEVIMSPPVATPPKVEAVPEAVPQTTYQPPLPPAKTSPIVVFFLVVIIILIVGSDLFFYLNYIATQ